MGISNPPPKINLPQRNFAQLYSDLSSQILVGCNVNNTLFFGATGGRILRYDENMLTILGSGNGLPFATCQALVSTSNNRLIAFFQNEGFYTSDDLGESFTLRQAVASNISGIASNGDIVISQVANSIVGWNSNNGGNSWGSSDNTFEATNNTAVNSFLRYYPAINLFARIGSDGFVAFSSSGAFSSGVDTTAGVPLLSQAVFNNYFYVGTNDGRLLRSPLSDIDSFLELDQSKLFYNRNSTIVLPQYTNLFVYNNNLYCTTNSGGIMFSVNGTDFLPCTSQSNSNIDAYATDGVDLIFTGSAGSTLLRNLSA